MSTRRSRLAVIAVGASAVLALTACSPDASEPDTGEQSDIVFWTPQVTPERIAAQEEIAAAFEAETGIGVEVVPLGGADQNQALVTGAASGDVPDVILHAPDQTAAWNEQGLLDTEVAQRIVDELDPSTFNERALDLVTLDGEVGAVPSDGWVHLIAYRADLFEAAGVEVPGSLEELAEAATTLAGSGVTGIALGTQPGTPSSTEAVESTFLTTGCQLVEDGTVTIDSDECTNAAESFNVLAQSSLAGEFDVPSARAAYLAGNAAMLLFSTHILDEVAGLDPDNPVTCAECAADPTFLAANTQFITILDESNPAQYGSTLNYGVPVGAHAEEAQMFIEYLLNDGYIDTLAMATEGRLPLRLGTPDEPTTFIDEWGTLPFGVDRASGQSIADVYGADIVEALSGGMDAISRWAFGTPDAPLEGAVFSQNVLSQNLDQLYAGTPAADVTATMAEQVSALQAELGLQ
ncbi:ABC transporter substrate-binding protein [Agromyces silvae]|uniref:ABC transporter substrate-binding protein n=1 Tax=Agromyces silvae TaxID=3388266 RepID=UPI00280B6D0D|nr:extracellular solute-binding protein [Agromyces protaetiae]